MNDLERINYSYPMSQDIRDTCVVADLKRLSWRGQFIKWGLHFWIAIAVLLEFTIIEWLLSGSYLPTGEYTVFNLGFAFATITTMFFAVWLYCWLQRRIFTARLREAGILEGCVSPEGVTEALGAFSSRCGWRGIAGVERSAKATVLLMGTGGGYVIPHESLLGGATPDFLHNQIEIWRKASA